MNSSEINRLNMLIPPSEKFYKASQLIDIAGDDIVNTFNNTLNSLLTWPLKASRGSVVDLNGHKSSIFGTIIYTASFSDQDIDLIEIKADSTACVIDISETMGLEDFRAAYHRISDAKKLKKVKISQTNGIPRNETLGIIYATQATLTLEALAEELQRLNQQTTCSQWPDIVAISSKGTINYTFQFPHEKKLTSFLLPSKDISTATFIPAFYIVPVITPTAQYTFNKVCSLVFSHLLGFSPGIKLPNPSEILEGSPLTGITTLPVYQFNLKGELLPVKPSLQMYYYLQSPQVFKDKHHDFSFTLQFLPWQDGGVILLRGKIPLQMLLIYLGSKIPNHNNTVDRGDFKISNVLPITETDYFQLLQLIQHRTNFKLQQTKKIIKHQFLEEGANSPFVARFFGILKLRDACFQNQAEQDKFDDNFSIILEKLSSIKVTSQEIVKLYNDHAREIAQGKTDFNKNINRELRESVTSFITNIARLFKNGIQKLTDFLDIKIGFLYAKSNVFHKEVDILKDLESDLVYYLKEVRKWSEPLTNCRNFIDHELKELDNIEYIENFDQIRAKEPHILDRPITEYVKFIFDRLICFTEDILTYCLKRRLPYGISVFEIPRLHRNHEMPLRFRLGLIVDGTLEWNMTYSQKTFEEK